jgi:hypothetical protein
MYGGKMNAVTNLDGPAVAMVLAGAFNADAGRIPGSPTVENFSADSGAGKFDLNNSMSRNLEIGYNPE